MITVFGSINIDLVFQPKDLPLPGETVLSSTYRAVAGGKGANQALAAKRAGVPVRMVGCIGSDAFSDTALSNLLADGIDLTHVKRTTSPTGCAAVVVNSLGENIIIVASGANSDVNANQVLTGLLNKTEILVLQMEIPHSENWQAVKIAKRAGARVILNVAPAAPVPVKILNSIDYIVINEIEADSIASKVGVGQNSITTFLANQHNLMCVMTLGPNGVIAENPNQKWILPAIPIGKAIDTTGAGDAFAGCFAAALALGKNNTDALHYAITGAGLSCKMMGTQTSFPTAEAISDALS